MLTRLSLYSRLIAVLENSDSVVLEDDFVFVRIGSNRVQSNSWQILLSPGTSALSAVWANLRKTGLEPARDCSR